LKVSVMMVKGQDGPDMRGERRIGEVMKSLIEEEDRLSEGWLAIKTTCRSKDLCFAGS
jgi:hypothetical protein